MEASKGKRTTPLSQQGVAVGWPSEVEAVVTTPPSSTPPEMGMVSDEATAATLAAMSRQGTHARTQAT